MEFPTNLGDFAVWLGTAGAGGVIIALLLETQAWWKDWQSPAKKYVTIGIFVGLPFLSKLAVWALATADPGLVKTVEDTLATLLYGLTAWGASQFAHGSAGNIK